MKAIVDGLATEYLDTGKGPVLLLLHGWGSSYQVFSDLIQTLSKTHRIIAPNLPGFGGTEAPKTVWGVDDYTEFVAAFCSKLYIEPAVIMGHSFGGQIAVNAIGNGIFSPEKLILLGASAIRPKLTTKQRGIQAVAKTGKALLGTTALGAKARNKLYGSIGSSEYLDNPELQAIYRRVITEDQSEAAKLIKAKTLLVWGAGDKDAPIERGRKLEQLISGSKLRSFPGGHFIFLDAPTEVEAAVTEFVK